MSAPAPHLPPPAPPPPAPVRYYDGRGRARRRGLVGLAVLALAGGAGLGAWFAWDSWRADAADVVADLGTGPLPGGDAEASGAARAVPPDTVVLDAAEVRSVAVVGDSITQGSEAALRFTLTAAGVREIAIDGLTSRRIESGGGRDPEPGLDALRRLIEAGADPDVWVVALGTNDIGQYGEPEDYRDLVRAVLAELPDDRPLVWVDVYRGDRPEVTAQFNLLLRAELAGRDRTTVVSWYEQVLADPSLLRGDRVHPTTDGTTVFARLVAQGIATVAG